MPPRPPPQLVHLLLRTTTGTTTLASQVNSQPRRCAHFSAKYIHPIFRASEQEELLKTDPTKYHHLTFLPVRPARSEQTSSVFYDAVFQKVINHIMREGFKEKARGLLELTLCEIKRLQHSKLQQGQENIELNPLVLLHKAIQNARPFLMTQPVKRGGHTYQVPVPIRPNASLAIAIKWLIEAGKEKPDDVRFWFQFAREVVECAQGVGKVVKRKQDLHRVCEANRAYAHYRWG